MSLLRSPYTLLFVVLNAVVAYFIYGLISPSGARRSSSSSGRDTRGKAEEAASAPYSIPPPPAYRDYTLDELLPFNGVERENILLAVDQRIYDVSSARHHYGPDGAYGALGGRDASRALATHSIPRLKPGQMQGWDDLNDLTGEERASLNSWTAFFDGKYPRVGTLVRVHSWAGSENEDRDSVRGMISDEIEIPTDDG